MKRQKKTNSSGKTHDFNTKVMTIVGTRPELIKLSEVIKKLDRFTHHQFVHTGQNFDYELNEIFYKDLNLRKPDLFLNIARETPIETIAAVLTETDRAIQEFAPDAILIYGDTNSCLAGYCAKRRKIPLFHMEAGNRCFDLRVPEEINRKMIDHLADVNMTNSEHARQYLIREGVSQQSIVMTGSPMKEILEVHKNKVKKSQILKKLKLSKDNYFIVSLHREENVDSAQKLKIFQEFLLFLAEEYQKPIIFSVHPRTQKRFESAGLKLQHRLISALKPLGFTDYLKLQQDSLLVISDSGTITEESSLLGFKAITPRAVHERPEGTDLGVLIKTPLEQASLRRAVQTAIQLSAPSPVPDYQNARVSEVVLKLILSQIDLIRRNNWFQNQF